MNWSALRQLFGANEPLKRRMLELFIRESERDIAALTAACATRDSERARIHAHQLAGAARTVGAEALALAAKALEEPSVYEQDARVESLAADARVAVEAVHEAIRAELG
jgi:HPt (histidine-containing phosphotransfer) domain-containing protein